MSCSRRTLLLLTFGSELLLTAIAASWAYFRQQSLFTSVSSLHLWTGLLGALPLMVVNYLLFMPSVRNSKEFSVFFDFRQQILTPLACQLDLCSALFISSAAGFGEELFFRACLQQEIGLLGASAAFALLHFGPAVKKYWPVAAAYFVLGLYLGWLYDRSGNVVVPMLAHAAYDFAALVYLRKAAPAVQ